MKKEEVAKLQSLRNELNHVIIGKEKQVEMVCVALLAGGHILLEDVPGVGKTTLAKAVATLIGSTFGRIQFTPDTMPADVIGFSMYQQNKDAFVFREGPVMKQVLLADEINRTSPKTQSALLEAMEERQVTVDGITHPLSKPFFVIATQNPLDFLGTYRLPEAQLDRFFCRISLGYPKKEAETEMINKLVDGIDWKKMLNVLDSSDILHMQEEVSKVKVHEDLVQYVLDIIEATRNHEHITLGVSPRGTLALVRGSMALAYLKGRDYVIPEDIVTCLVPVLAHRIVLSTEARLKKLTAEGVILDIKNDHKIPIL